MASIVEREQLITGIALAVHAPKEAQKYLQAMERERAGVLTWRPGATAPTPEPPKSDLAVILGDPYLRAIATRIAEQAQAPLITELRQQAERQTGGRRLATEAQPKVRQRRR